MSRASETVLSLQRECNPIDSVAITTTGCTLLNLTMIFLMDVPEPSPSSSNGIADCIVPERYSAVLSPTSLPLFKILKLGIMLSSIFTFLGNLRKMWIYYKQNIPAERDEEVLAFEKRISSAITIFITGFVICFGAELWGSTHFLANLPQGTIPSFDENTQLLTCPNHISEIKRFEFFLLGMSTIAYTALLARFYHQAVMAPWQAWQHAIRNTPFLLRAPRTPEQTDSPYELDLQENNASGSPSKYFPKKPIISDTVVTITTTEPSSILPPPPIVHTGTTPTLGRRPLLRPAPVRTASSSSTASLSFAVQASSISYPTSPRSPGRCSTSPHSDHLTLPAHNAFGGFNP